MHMTLPVLAVAIATGPLPAAQGAGPASPPPPPPQQAAPREAQPSDRAGEMERVPARQSQKLAALLQTEADRLEAEVRRLQKQAEAQGRRMDARTRAALDAAVAALRREQARVVAFASRARQDSEAAWHDVRAGAVRTYREAAAEFGAVDRRYAPECGPGERNPVGADRPECAEPESMPPP